MIKANAHKYSVSAMCRVLQVNRSTYYYEAATKKDESELTADIQEIFRKSRNHYGTRKIKKELADCGKQVSRRRIGRIMKQEGLISSYTTAQFKPQKDRCNESKVENVLNRQCHDMLSATFVFKSPTVPVVVAIRTCFDNIKSD